MTSLVWRTAHTSSSGIYIHRKEAVLCRGRGGGVSLLKWNREKEEKPILLNNKTSSSHFTLGLKLIIKRQRQNRAIYQTPYTTRQYTRRPHVYKAPIHYTAQHKATAVHNGKYVPGEGREKELKRGILWIIFLCRLLECKCQHTSSQYRF